MYLYHPDTLIDYRSAVTSWEDTDAEWDHERQQYNEDAEPCDCDNGWVLDLDDYYVPCPTCNPDDDPFTI